MRATSGSKIVSMNASSPVRPAGERAGEERGGGLARELLEGERARRAGRRGDRRGLDEREDQRPELVEGRAAARLVLLEGERHVGAAVDLALEQREGGEAVEPQRGMQVRRPMRHPSELRGGGVTPAQAGYHPSCPLSRRARSSGQKSLRNGQLGPGWQSGTSRRCGCRRPGRASGSGCRSAGTACPHGGRCAAPRAPSTERRISRAAVPARRAARRRTHRRPTATARRVRARATRPSTRSRCRRRAAGPQCVADLPRLVTAAQAGEHPVEVRLRREDVRARGAARPRVQLEHAAAVSSACARSPRSTSHGRPDHRGAGGAHPPAPGIRRWLRTVTSRPRSEQSGSCRRPRRTRATAVDLLRDTVARPRGFGDSARPGRRRAPAAGGGAVEAVALGHRTRFCHTCVRWP